MDVPESTDDSSDAQIGAIRRLAQTTLSRAGEAGRHGKQRVASKSDVAAKGLDAASRGSKVASEKAGQARTRVNSVVGKATDSMSLAPYRAAVDSALAEAVAIILAQEAEIRALEDRVAALEERSNG